MQINTKFNIGQRVWIVLERDKWELTDCDLCNRTGKIALQGQDYECPKCKGQSKHNKYRGAIRFIETDGIIGQVEVTYLAPEYLQEDEAGYGGTAYRVETTYMINSTGVRSGNNWNEKSCFGSQEEAQEHCDRFNSKTEHVTNEMQKVQKRSRHQKPLPAVPRGA